ncbi:MAG: TlpA family protein disulfide reductase [Actinomycetota bacterium]
MGSQQRIFGSWLVRFALIVVVGIAGCSADTDTISGQAAQGGYVAGDGSVERIATADRRTEITLRGNDLSGTPIDSSAWRGQVIVINTWGSWCPPCNDEAPTLAAAATKYAESEVRFLGVNLRDGPDAARAFQERYDFTFPSLRWDADVILQLQGKASATPTTLILDRRGLVAARVSGAAEQSVLTGLVDDVLAEPAS